MSRKQKTNITILTSKAIKFTAVFALILLPASVFAQSSFTLSVTPTLFQVSAEPGQVWQSSVKVINSNSFPITVYAEPVNFTARDEAGHGKFVPVFDEVTDGTTLAEWIKLDKFKPIEIPAEESMEVPFSVVVPEDASPGGHFAAILLGTRQPSDGGQLAVQTSQIVSSLFFVRIEGDVVEEGFVRSFSVVDRLVDVPKADFRVRFENRGNVHLQPQGQIQITNMWGKERGFIPINYSTHFGNVLPESIRTFEFSWEGEKSISDIGRYKAEVSLAYGTELKKSVTKEVYFWVLPLKPLFITIIIIGLFVWFIAWAVKSYVRRVLTLAGLNPDNQYQPPSIKKAEATDHELDISSYQKLSAPVRFGYQDLMDSLSSTKVLSEKVKTIMSFVVTYRTFFVAVTTIVIFFVCILFFWKSVSQNERTYQVSIQNPDQKVAYNSEEIKLQELLTNDQSLNNFNKDQQFNLSVINTSGIPGAAADLAAKLIGLSYQVDSLSSDITRKEYRTVIVYDSSVQEEALLLSKQLNGALLSSNVNTNGEAKITVFVGGDRILTR